MTGLSPLVNYPLQQVRKVTIPEEDTESDASGKSSSEFQINLTVFSFLLIFFF